MRPLSGIKSSFGGGEFGPSLYSRIDLAKYSTGARKLRNFIVHPHGGISNRPGLEHIGTEKTDGKKIRVIPFEFSTTQTYVIELGEYYARFYSDGEPVEMTAIEDSATLLLHGDGVDASQTITDELGKTVTAVGTAQIDTAQKVFGTGSILFDGDSDYLTVPDHADWNLGTGNFTIDFRVRFSAIDADYYLVSQWEDAENYWYFRMISDNTLNFLYKSGNSEVANYTMTNAWSGLAINTWYHIALVRNGTSLKMYIDGVSQALTENTAISTNDLADVASVLYIGASHVPNQYFNGWMEEFRVLKGTAKWTENFTLPVAAYDLTGDADAWVTTTTYAIGDFVSESEMVYRCLIAHTSGTFATDLAAGKWVQDATHEVVTPYDEDDLANIQYTQSADVLYLNHPDYAPRQLERAGNADWSLNLYDYQNGPFQLANVTTSKTLAISAVTGDDKTLTASGFTLNSQQVGALFKLRHYIEGQADTAAITGTGAESSIKCGGTWRIITHGTWTGTIRVEKSTDSGSSWTMLREFSSADDYNVDTYGAEDMSDYAEPFLVRVNCTAYTSGTCNANLTSDPFYQEGIVKITAVASDGVTATADVKRTCGLTSATIDWSESSWSDYRGWPAVVEFHPEDRLTHGNTKTEPYTYWMTRSANYTDFSRSSPLQDDDGISTPLPGRKVNGINGLIPLNEMVALTLSNEVSIRSSSGPLTPTTAYNKVHGWEGSYGIKPVVIGNRAIYVQSTGSIVRDLGFDLYSESFVGEDLTVYSNHLFFGYTISEMAYQQNPDRIVWIVRDDGILLSMTYMREQEVIAWSWHDTNDGDDLFESVCSIRGDGYDEVYVVVNRNGTRHIERMVQRMASTALEDQFFVDSGYIYDSTETTTVTGLAHLASKAVSVLADGVVVSGKTVSAAGVLTLDTAASVIQVGLAYKSDLETLNVEVTLPDGTAQGRKIHIPNVVLRLLNTQGGYIGRDEDHLYALNLESRADYDEDVFYSGDHGVTLGPGFAEGGRFFYRQSDPLPVTITGLIPQVSVGGHTNVR